MVSQEPSALPTAEPVAETSAETSAETAVGDGRANADGEDIGLGDLPRRTIP